MEEREFESSWGKVSYLDSAPDGVVGDGARASMPVVFLHGWLGSPQTVTHLQRDERMLRQRIIAPYLPGHGRSFALPEGFSFRDLARAIGELVRSLGASRVALSGHSMGASAAWEIAAAEPELVDRLLLVHPYSNPRQRSAASIIGTALLEEGALTGIGDYDPLKPAAVQKAVEDKQRGLGVTALRRLWHVAKTVSLSPGAAVACPTLLIFGAKDRLSTLEDFRAEVAPGASSLEQVLPGGHYWFWKDPVLLVDMFDAFLDSTTRRATALPPSVPRTSWQPRFDEHPTGRRGIIPEK